MRICIWYKIIQAPWGGSNNFLTTLGVELERQGYVVTHTPSRNDDIVLVNSWSLGASRYINPGQVLEVQKTGRVTLLGRILPLSFWKKVSLKKTPVIHRVDGVARLYGRQDQRADKTQFKITQIVDYVVFQSKYSQDSFAQFDIYPSQPTVIHNAVDGDVFFPGSHRHKPHSPLRLVASSWSTNPMKGFAWLPRLALLPNIEMYFIGNWCPSVHPGKVQLLGVKSRPELASILREMDVFVHPAENDNCPNIVLEALATGLPIIYHNSGGTPELASDFGLVIEDNLEAIIDQMRSQYTDFHQKILAARSKFLIETCTEKYISIFQQAIEARL